MNNEEWVLKVEGITKIYKRGSQEVQAISRISFQVGRGEFVYFIGPSGSAKTTLINVLGCLDSATSGILVVGGMAIFSHPHKLSKIKLTEIRCSIFGYVFQRFYLIPTLIVFENVILPFSFYRKKRDDQRPKGYSPLSRPRGPYEPATQRTFGRGDATGSHCPGSGQQPGNSSRRRANRKPGQPKKSGNRPDPQGPQWKRGSDRIAGHPQLRSCPAWPPNYRASRWPHPKPTVNFDSHLGKHHLSALKPVF